LIQREVSSGGDQQGDHGNQEGGVGDHQPNRGTTQAVARLRELPIGGQQQNEGSSRPDPGHGEHGHRSGARHQHGEPGEQIGGHDEPDLSEITSQVSNCERLDDRTESQHQHRQDQRQGIQLNGG
jgi:hypothetical protein